MTTIKIVNFNDEMQQNAFLIAEQATDRFNDCKDVAYFIRSEMKKIYDHEWNCFVTDSNENPDELGKYKSYLCYKYNDYIIHLWYEPSDSEEGEQSQEHSENYKPTVDIDDIPSLFAKYDSSKNGKLEFDEFLGFMKEGLDIPINPGFSNQMRFIFDGMDIDGSHNVDQNEIIECLKKYRQGDFKWISKMVFRGADINKSRKVSIDELKLAGQCLGIIGDSTDFENRCNIEFGKKKSELEYWEFYKVITGENLDKHSIDADPYEGKLPTKSKCCLLL